MGGGEGEQCSPSPPPLLFMIIISIKINFCTLNPHSARHFVVRKVLSVDRKLLKGNERIRVSAVVFGAGDRDHKR